MSFQHPQSLLQHPDFAAEPAMGIGITSLGGGIDGGAAAGCQHGVAILRRPEVVEPGERAGLIGQEAAFLADQLRRSLDSAEQLDEALGQIVSFLA